MPLNICSKNGRCIEMNIFERIENWRPSKTSCYGMAKLSETQLTILNYKIYYVI